MDIIHLNETALSAGRDTFKAYMAAAVCGPGSQAYEHGQSRETGALVLIGVILACIDAGLNTADEIVCAASRASKCRSWTVISILGQLTGNDPELHLWTFQHGRYRKLDTGPKTGNAAKMLLAA